MAVDNPQALPAKSSFEYVFTSHLSSQTTNNPYLPANTIIGFIAQDRESVRALRRVSKTLSKWVKPYERQALEKIYFTYPAAFPELRSLTYEALSRIREYVVHLHIKIKPTNNLPQRPRLPDLNCVLHLENLTYLTITLLPIETTGLEFLTLCNTAQPAKNDPVWTWFGRTPADTSSSSRPSHHRSLIHLREALEASVHVLKRLKTLVFTNLSISGLQAFRNSSFGSFKSPGEDEDNHVLNCRFWKQIHHLNVRLIRWWDISGPFEQSISASEAAFERPENPESKQISNSGSATEANIFLPLSPGDAQMKACISTTMPPASIPTGYKDKDKDAYRQGLFHLHDWLKSFTPSLLSLTFTWIREEPLSSRTAINCNSCGRSSHGRVDDTAMTFRARLEGYDISSGTSAYSPFVSEPILPPTQGLPFRRCMGVHPLFIDKLSSITSTPASSSSSWFSPPHLRWPQLRALVLSGAASGGSEVALLKDRAPLLRRLRVALDCVQPGVQSLGLGADHDGICIAELRLWHAVVGGKEVTSGVGVSRSTSILRRQGKKENFNLSADDSALGQSLPGGMPMYRELKEKSSVGEMARTAVGRLTGKGKVEKSNNGGGGNGSGVGGTLRKKRPTLEDTYGYLPGMMR